MDIIQVIGIICMMYVVYTFLKAGFMLLGLFFHYRA